MFTTERERLERLIIASLIMDYDWLIDYLDIPIDTQNITHPRHLKILKAMKECWTWDPVIIASKCDVRIDEIWEISWDALSVTENSFQMYVEELKEYIQKDKLYSDLTMAVLELKSWKDLNYIYSELNKIKSEPETTIDDSEIALEILKEINWESEVKIIKTGYRDLDKLVWGYEKCQVIVIWARPWIWKSMFAINLANNNLLAWEKVALFSLEMNKKQVFRRLVAMNSWVWVRKLKEKNEWEAKERANKWVEKLLEQLKTFYCFDDVHTIDELERKIRFLVHKYGVSIVYLDYLQLLRNPSVKNNPVESITDMSQRLKQLALQLWITIVELSQLNRDADNSVIQKASQLRWSWSIEQDADMVWILQKDDEASNKITVWIRKCRDWRIGDVELFQISDIMRITDINKPF